MVHFRTCAYTRPRLASFNVAPCACTLCDWSFVRVSAGGVLATQVCLLGVRSPQEVWQEFEAARVPWEDYAERATELLADPELTIRIGGDIMPWREAQPYVVASLFYGFDAAAAMKPTACISVVRLLCSWCLPPRNT